MGLGAAGDVMGGEEVGEPMVVVAATAPDGGVPSCGSSAPAERRPADGPPGSVGAGSRALGAGGRRRAACRAGPTPTGERDAVVGEGRADLMRQGFDQGPEAAGGSPALDARRAKTNRPVRSTATEWRRSPSAARGSAGPMWRKPVGCRSNFRLAGLSPTSGGRLAPRRCKGRCGDGRRRSRRPRPCRDRSIAAPAVPLRERRAAVRVRRFATAFGVAPWVRLGSAIVASPPAWRAGSRRCREAPGSWRPPSVRGGRIAPSNPGTPPPPSARAEQAWTDVLVIVRPRPMSPRRRAGRGPRRDGRLARQKGGTRAPLRPRRGHWGSWPSTPST